MIWRTSIIKAKLCSIPHKFAMATSNTASIKERTKTTTDISFRLWVCLLLDSSTGCSLIGFPRIQQNWKTCIDCNNVHTNIWLNFYFGEGERERERVLLLDGATSQLMRDELWWMVQWWGLGCGTCKDRRGGSHGYYWYSPIVCATQEPRVLA